MLLLSSLGSTMAEIPKAEKLVVVDPMPVNKACSRAGNICIQKTTFFCKESLDTSSLPLFDPLCWYFSTVFLVPSICFGILLQLIYHFRKWYQNMHGTWHAPLEMSFFEETEDIESQQFSFQFGHWQIAGDMVEMLSWTEIHDWFHFSRIDKRFVQIFSYELLLLLLTLFCFINTIPTQYFHLCRFFYVVVYQMTRVYYHGGPNSIYWSGERE